MVQLFTTKQINETLCSIPDSRTCADKPCFAGVQCQDRHINLNSIEYLSGDVKTIKRFECGPCPEKHIGDGETCKSKYCIQIFTWCLSWVHFFVWRAVITNPKSLSDIRKTYPKAVLFQKKNFFGFIFHSMFENVSDFLSQFFGYHISDIRKAFLICYDAIA